MLNLLNLFSLKRSPLLSQFHILLFYVLLFHVLQFHALHIGPSFSHPAFSAPPYTEGFGKGTPHSSLSVVSATLILSSKMLVFYQLFVKNLVRLLNYGWNCYLRTAPNLALIKACCCLGSAEDWTMRLAADDEVTYILIWIIVCVRGQTIRWQHFYSWVTVVDMIGDTMLGVVLYLWYQCSSSVVVSHPSYIVSSRVLSPVSKRDEKTACIRQLLRLYHRQRCHIFLM